MKIEDIERAGERLCKCGAPTARESVVCERLDCLVEYSKDHAPPPSRDYTRGRRDGMRRAVEIARELESGLDQYEWFSVGELSEAVEKELG